MNQHSLHTHADNNPELFLDAISTHKGIIYKIANAYCRNAEDRKDLVQEIIIQLWKSFDKYDDRYRYSTFIYRIALNTAISFYRKERRRKEVALPLAEDVLQLVDDNRQPVQEEQLSLLQQCIASLKDLDKALMLLYLEEKSMKEISVIMEMSATNVSTKISRIKKVIQQKFSTIQKLQ